jgi:hypothetical protein
MEGSLALIERLFDEPSTGSLTYINGLDLKGLQGIRRREAVMRRPVRL